MTIAAHQAELGRRSGAARRRKAGERNEAILAMLSEGHTQADTARHFGVHRNTVRNIISAEGSLCVHEPMHNEPTQDDAPNPTPSQ